MSKYNLALPLEVIKTDKMYYSNNYSCDDSPYIELTIVDNNKKELVWEEYYYETEEEMNDEINRYQAIVEAVNNSARYREALEKIKNMECMPESIEDFYIDSFYKNCNRFLRIPQDIARIALEGGNE